MGTPEVVEVSAHIATEFVTCDLCGSSQEEELCWARDLMHGVPGTYRLVRCRQCGLVYINPRPTEEASSLCYPESYAPHQIALKGRRGPRRQDRIDRCFYSGRRSQTMGALLDKATTWPLHLLYREKNYRMSRRKPGRVLDIGCGSGDFLLRLRNLGWEAHGVEFAEEVALAVARSSGMDVRPGGLLDHDFPSDYFDWITLWWSLEHMPHPCAVLTECRRLLKGDGVITVAVPDFGSWAARRFRDRWFHLDVPRHLYHFSLATLSASMRRGGLTPFKRRTTRMEGIAGSVQYLRHRDGRPGRRLRSLTRGVLRAAEVLLVLARVNDVMIVEARKNPTPL